MSRELCWASGTLNGMLDASRISGNGRDTELSVTHANKADISYLMVVEGLNNPVMVFINAAIKPAKFYLSSAIICRVSIFGYTMYSSAEGHCWQQASAEHWITEPDNV